MSISFVKKRDKLSERVYPFITQQIQEKKAGVIAKYLIKQFDTHFLHYIAYRKQRDLLIVNYFYQSLLHDVNVDKKIFKKYEINADIYEDGRIDFNKVLPINANEITLHLENEISILKSLHEVFTSLSSLSLNLQNNGNIQVKLRKVEALNDQNFFNRITKNEAIKKQILQKLGVVKEYAEIASNAIFYLKVKKEVELLLAQ